MTVPFSRQLLAFALAALLLAGCAAPPGPQPRDSLHTASPAEEEAPPSAPGPPAEPPAPAEPEQPVPLEPLGIGDAVFADPGDLTPGQQEAVLALFIRWYDSLARLELRDPADLFAPEAAAQYLGNCAVWRYIVEIRRMQRTDLGLTAYHAELSCRELEENEDGSVTFRLTEDSVQNFRATPDVDSEQKNVYHQFTLLPLGEDRWAVSAHSQLDSLYWTVMGRYAYRPVSASSADAADTRTEAELALYYEERVEELLETARQDVTDRFTRGEEQTVAASRPYDRQKAAAYARQWVGVRNGSWPDYSRNGGNCQNFVSQCLLAGGIPMDVCRPGIWKWYGSTPNNLPQAAGRSAAWSAVSEFLEYARDNTGYGLAAAVDAPYYTGRVGDVIHLGTAGRWRHTVLITGLVEDGAGNIEDYLICSNTADLRDFPVSAYAYTQQLLIRIEGWNG